MSTRSWATLLSKRQRCWAWVTVAAMLVIVSGGVFSSRSGGSEQQHAFSVDQSIHQIAPHLGVTGKALARDLKLPLDSPKQKPLKALGITAAELQEAIHHIQSHRSSGLKYFVFVALVLGALVFLVRLGRPDATGPNQRQHWYPRGVHLAFLAVAVVVCGFALGKSPNPMEGTVKVFKAAVGLYPDPWIKVLLLLLFVVLAVVGNKIICGWACPFGALQELVHSLPILRRAKQKLKIPFLLTNAIRAILFACMLLILFGVIGHRKGFVIYHFLNPFNLFSLDIESLAVGITVGVALLLSLIIYRPFCHLICPFGLISWLAERVSLFRVKVDHTACIDCGQCAKACPSDAMSNRLQRRTLPADCFSCGRCLNVCPVDAIAYGGRATRTDQAGGSHTGQLAENADSSGFGDDTERGGE
jgi:ferredoxin